ncbi:MAG: hypothetical protein WCH75_27660 [Candidatus Binatia bacterium]
MLKKRYTFAQDFGLASDGWVATEPTDADKFEKQQKRSVRDGEERLMMAVLEDAIQCFQQYALSTRPREKRLFQEAEDWFLDKESEYIFSFEFISETLGFHPDNIRRGLLAWKESKQKVDEVKPDAKPRTKLHRTRYLPKQYRLAKAG